MDREKPRVTAAPVGTLGWAPLVCLAALSAVGIGLRNVGSQWGNPLKLEATAPLVVETPATPVANIDLDEANPFSVGDLPADAMWPTNLLTDEFVAGRYNISVETVQRLHAERSLDNEQLARISERRLQRALWRLDNPKADQPGEAIKWRLLRHRDERGQIKPDGLTNAMRQLDLMTKASTRAGIAGIPSGPGRSVGPAANQRAGLDPTKWEWLGPGNIGGRTRSMLIDPSNPQIMYAGSVGGGVWKTTNGGNTWSALPGLSANLAVSTMAMSPLNPQVILAGTGEGFFNADAIRGAGIFVTTNGGNTWSQVPSTNTPEFQYVNRIAISPNGQTVLVATNSGLFRSTNGGQSYSIPGGGVNTRMLDVDFHPTDSNRCICSTAGARVWASTDGGANFTAATGLNSTGDFFSFRTEVCYSRATPATIYASVDRGGGTIFRSTDNGATFSQRHTGSNYLGSQGWYDNIIWAGDPNNADRVIVGGIDLWRSTNGGTDVARISQWQLAPLSAHADHHEIITPPAYDGTSNNTLLFGNDGGLYYGGNLWDTSAANVTWQEINNNYGVTQFYGGDGNAQANRYFGGTQDNGTNSVNYTGAASTENWTMYIGGDGGFAAADPTDANFLYGEFQFLGIHRSSNGGVSATPIYQNLPDSFANTNFIAPFVLDPNNPRRLLAGGASLWASVDCRAPTVAWQSIKAPTSSLISAIAVNPRNSNEVWVGHNNGDVFFTSNGTSATPTWVKRDGTTLPNRYCERIAVDPRTSTTIYATFGGFNPDNVWKSTNGGQTWTNISVGLPSAPMNGICAHPSKANWIYVGSEVGVFGSEDGGATWSPTNEGPLNVAVDEVKFVGNFLLAVTHGRGMYRINPTATNPGGGSGGFVRVTYTSGTRTLALNEFIPTGGTANGNTISVSRRGNSITVQAGGGTKLRIGNSNTDVTSYSVSVGSQPINIDSNLNAGADSITLTSLNLNLCKILLGTGADKAILNFCNIVTSQIDGGVDQDVDVLTLSTTTITTNQNIRIP